MRRWFCILPSSDMRFDLVAFGPVGMSPCRVYEIASKFPKVIIERKMARGTVMYKKPHFTASINIQNQWRRAKSAHIYEGVRLFWMPNHNKLPGTRLEHR